MPQQVKRFFFVVFIIFIFVIVISIAVPIIYSSAFYDELTGSSDWTPRPTQTSTPTMIVVSLPSIQPTATPQDPSTPTISSNCVYPTEYWIEHPELWPEQLILGNATYYRDDMKLIFRSVSLELHQMIVKFYYLAYLNIIAGADPATIDDSLLQVNNWLYTHPTGSQLTEDDKRVGVQLVQTLIDYNTGFLGPGICPPYEAPTQTIVTIEPTITSTFTDTPSATPIRVTQTPTPLPTRTRNPTDKPPKITPKPPTVTPQPQNTPTTEPTEIPPTPIPTEEPTPTPVP